MKVLDWVVDHVALEPVLIIGAALLLAGAYEALLHFGPH